MQYLREQNEQKKTNLQICRIQYLLSYKVNHNNDGLVPMLAVI